MTRTSTGTVLTSWYDGSTGSGLKKTQIDAPPTDQHVAVGVVGDGEEMRRHLRATLALVFVDDVLSVDRQATVRIDDDAEQSRIRLEIIIISRQTLMIESWQTPGTGQINLGPSAYLSACRP